MEGPEDRVPCEDFTTCGVAQFQNRQYWKNAKQQDSYFVVEDMAKTFGVRLGNSEMVALYGVADGHGEFGEISANFVRRNLPPQLAHSPHFAAGRLNDALLESFTQTEGLQQSAGLPLWASGSCVTAAAVSPTHIVVANCGDCRAVLADQGTAQDLSSDHNVERATPEEVQRILNSGGIIMPDKRVTIEGAPGRLATTRSLGDYWAKPQGPVEKHVVSGLPELRTVARQPGQQYLVLASDGIFGFMSSQDVVTLCVTSAREASPSTPLSRLAHTVLCTAVNHRRSDDNCTCLVVDLSKIKADLPGVPRMLPGTSGYGHEPLAGVPQTPPGGKRGGRYEEALERSPKDDSDVSISSLVAPDEVCWCPWCWRQSQDGHPENVVLGSFERWRLHMHEQHFDKLGGAYGPDEVVPCYWCCRPCVTKKGQGRKGNRLPFWGSHERVCRENPNKPALPNQAQSTVSSSLSSSDRRPGGHDDPWAGETDRGSDLRSSSGYRQHHHQSGGNGVPTPSRHHARHQASRGGGGYPGGGGCGCGGRFGEAASSLASSRVPATAAHAAVRRERGGHEAAAQPPASSPAAHGGPRRAL